MDGILQKKIMEINKRVLYLSHVRLFRLSLTPSIPHTHSERVHETLWHPYSLYINYMLPFLFFLHSNGKKALEYLSFDDDKAVLSEDNISAVPHPYQLYQNN